MGYPYVVTRFKGEPTHYQLVNMYERHVSDIGVTLKVYYSLGYYLVKHNGTRHVFKRVVE